MGKDQASYNKRMREFDQHDRRRKREAKRRAKRATARDKAPDNGAKAPDFEAHEASITSPQRP